MKKVTKIEEYPQELRDVIAEVVAEHDQILKDIKDRHSSVVAVFAPVLEFWKKIRGIRLTALPQDDEDFMTFNDHAMCFCDQNAEPLTSLWFRGAWGTRRDVDRDPKVVPDFQPHEGLVIYAAWDAYGQARLYAGSPGDNQGPNAAEDGMPVTVQEAKKLIVDYGIFYGLEIMTEGEKAEDRRPIVAAAAAAGDHL